MTFLAREAEPSAIGWYRLSNRPAASRSNVTVTDPEAIENARREHPQLNYIADRDEALRGADVVIVVMEWDECRRKLLPEHAASMRAGRIIIDGRNCLEPAAGRSAG
ncbi:UDP binding domain-containing protein [Microbacterium sp. Mu-80]|uniref:UDP binding domain-containing protein n=1 Tax=Microbacterium bandirmense TaxID=3122050 RepID=A0ABU8LFC1_9MICO